jgi:hypothetical protein
MTSPRQAMIQSLQQTLTASELGGQGLGRNAALEGRPHRLYEDGSNTIAPRGLQAIYPGMP